MCSEVLWLLEARRLTWSLHLAEISRDRVLALFAQLHQQQTSKSGVKPPEKFHQSEHTHLPSQCQTWTSLKQKVYSLSPSEQLNMVPLFQDMTFQGKLQRSIQFRQYRPIIILLCHSYSILVLTNIMCVGCLGLYQNVFGDLAQRIAL